MGRCRLLCLVKSVEQCSLGFEVYVGSMLVPEVDHSCWSARRIARTFLGFVIVCVTCSLELSYADTLKGLKLFWRNMTSRQRHTS